MQFLRDFYVKLVLHQWYFTIWLGDAEMHDVAPSDLIEAALGHSGLKYSSNRRRGTAGILFLVGRVNTS